MIQGERVPHLISYRRARGLPEAPPVDLSAAIRTQIAGFRALQSGLAHLVVAYRATCGDGAADYARLRLTEWLEDLGDDELDAWADALVADARLVREEKR